MKTYFMKALHPINFPLILGFICTIVFFIGLIIDSGFTMFFGLFMGLPMFAMSLLVASVVAKEDYYDHIDPNVIEFVGNEGETTIVAAKFNVGESDEKTPYKIYRKKDVSESLDPNQFYVHRYKTYLGETKYGNIYYMGDNAEYFNCTY